MYHNDNEIMLKPLTIAGREFTNNIIQGPLAGVSSSPFRQLIWRYSQPAYVCSEMISCKTIIHNPIQTYQRFIKKAAGEGPLSVQLSANNAQELADAVKIVTDFGVELIDLNCGCPVKKIRKRGAGSKLLSTPSKLLNMITAMKNNTHLPVTVKIRVGARNEDSFNKEMASMIQDSGADALIVHGRHWTEHYETPCRFDDITYFADTLSIPVIGNGDVSDLESLQNMLHTGCNGIMLSRATVGRPWLIEAIIRLYKGEKFFKPSFSEIGQMYIEHVSGLIGLLNSEKHAILQARKFAKYYARNMQVSTTFHQRIQQCETFTDFKLICHDCFG